MTVKELIDKLKTLDPDKKLFIILSNDNPVNDGLTLDDIYEISGSKNETLNAVYLQTN